MKIEIEIPLDENEWEVVSIEALPHYAVTDEISTYKNYVTIKKKAKLERQNCVSECV
jgi:hypothetical protein